MGGMSPFLHRAPLGVQYRLIAGILAVTHLALGVPGPALAALDSPASWEQRQGSSPGAGHAEPFEGHPVDSPWNLWESHFGDDGVAALLEDRDERISPEFRVPREMREQVRFWLRIYTQLSSRQVVIFDEEHPELVYEVVDFRNLARTARNRAAYEIVSRQALKKKIAAYRQAFARLKSRGGAKGSRPSPELRNVMRARALLKHPHRLEEMQKNLRVQWGQRDQVIEGLLASAPYRTRMDHVFEEMRLPRELTLLSLVESSFNTKAVSRTGAAGVWQFMPASGAEFMLVAEHQGVDERISPIKSTVAAARLLQRNLKILGSWPAAISAYNNGHAKWLRVSPRERQNPGRILTQCAFGKAPAARFGFASRNYYAEFLALLRAERYQELAFGPAPRGLGQPVRFVEVDRPLALAELSEQLRLAPATLMELNPDVLSTRRSVPPGFLLAVPALQDDFSLIIAAHRGRLPRKMRSARVGSLRADAGPITSRRPRG